MPKRTVPDLFAEFLREVAVLVLVFYPLEQRTTDPNYLSKKAIFSISAVLMAFGILIERLRPER